MVIEEIFSWFSDNPLVTFIGSVGLLLMTFLAVKETLEWINNGRKKPKLKIIPHTYVDISNDKMQVRFSITVKNVGKSLAKDCSISARYTGIGDKSFHEIPLSKQMFPLDWIYGDEKRRTIDLFTKHSEGFAELPLKSYVGLDDMSFGIDTTIKKDYDEGYSYKDIFIDDEKGNRYYNLQVIFHIRYNSKVEEKHFMIKIKTNPAPISKEDVTFTPLDTH
ncbi:MAG: hypothetical protein COV65_04940 [Nitrosopumilales archaeon CG11_big_fil_rev_8_21_14_0_20_33_24]|nr:MAG: hypothetical protein COV65_04940 [Nitrosopumilales archaeon CG11_big_fil_rev_8_21_14_0_20_33_24]